jgi:DNA polymerase III alpha subunit/intein/homing endonuclease
LSFFHLHNHTEASIADGLFGPKKWVEALKDKGFKAHAITDHGVMTSLIPFYKLAREEGILPILGCEFYYTDNPTIKSAENRKSSHLILIAKNYDGFRNLLRLSNLSFTEGYYYKNRIGLEWLTKHSEGLICLTACQGGVLAREVWRERAGEKSLGLEERFAQFSAIFGQDLYIEFQGHYTKSINKETGEAFDSQEMINRAFYERLKDLPGFQPIVTNDCHYILPEHAKIQKTIKDISWKTGNSAAGESATVTEDHFTDSLWLKTGKQVFETFKKNHEYLPSRFVADGMINTMEVMEKCKDFVMPEGKRYLPTFRPGIDSKDLFKKLTKKMLLDFLKSGDLRVPKDQYVERFKKEFRVITTYGLEDYFLIVWDLIRFARKRGIYVGVGRGSAAGCLISYLLGIVKIDPLEYKLIFERFLNENRCVSGEMPDIDLDFESDRRKEIKDYIFETYGHDRVCEIGTYGRMKLRTSLIDFGKAMGVATQRELLAITTKLDLDKEDADSLGAAIEADINLHRMMAERPDYAFAVEEIIGQIKSQGVHPAGVVICSEPIADITPMKTQKKTLKPEDVEPGEPKDIRILTTQSEDKHIIAQGLMKCDILGLKEYDVIRYVLENADCSLNPETYVRDLLEMERLKPNERVWKMFQQGKTEGVFQFACLSGDTVICVKSKKTIRDVYSQENKKNGKTQLSCLLLDEGKWRRSGIRAIKSTGVRKTYRMVTEDRRFIRSTSDHQFLTPDGWKNLSELSVGDSVGFRLNWGSPRVDGFRLCTDCGVEKLSGSDRCHPCSAKFHKNPSFHKDKLRKPKSVENWCKGKPYPKEILMVALQKRAVTWEKVIASGWQNPSKGKKRPEMSGRNNPMFGKTTRSRMGFRKDLGHFVRSSWEADYCRVLNYHGIEYKYEPETFDLGEVSYTPDFYLPREDRYVEIKGWMTEKSALRIKLFREKFPNKTLEVVNKTEFAEMALKYKHLVAWECPKFPEGFVWEKVKSIEEHGEEETFDLCMGNSAHNYVANGFVTHNSDGMKDLLINMRPDCINDLIAANALYRPGCLENGWHLQYCRRKNGEESVEYAHPDVEEALGDTYGVLVYQEQFMEAIHRLGGISLVDTDTIRSALGKKDKKKLGKFKERFVEGAAERIGTDKAEELWEQIEKAGGYTFNRCCASKEVIHRNWTHCEPLSIGEMFKLKNGGRRHAELIRKLPLYKKYQREGYGKAWSMRDGKLHPNRIVDIRYEGQREVYRCTTESGRKIDVTMNHKFPTPKGERKLEDLRVGDELYVNLGHKKEDTSYRFSERKGRSVVNAIKGKRGFQKVEDSSWALFVERRKILQERHNDCQLCFAELDRKEVHHIDGNHGNQEWSNLIMVCPSCHKKEHYKIGRTKHGEKGLEVGLEKIASIEFLEMDDVYDIEMEAPSHNFVVQSGIVTCNSHSAAYSVLAYISQYLKSYYPQHFWAAQLDWDTRKSKLEDMLTNRRAASDMGVQFILPHINLSKKRFRVLKGRVVWSLSSVKGIGPKAAHEIQSKQPFRDFEDFYTRVNKSVVKYNNIEALIYAGALDKFGDRRNLLKLIASRKKGKHYSEISEEDLIMRFSDSMGFFERGLKATRPGFSPSCITETTLREFDAGETVRVGGMVKDVKSIKTKSGDAMGFATLMDLDEMIELTFFPKTWAAHRSAIHDGSLVEVVGNKSGYRNKQNAVEVASIQKI